MDLKQLTAFQRDRILAMLDLIRDNAMATAGAALKAARDVRTGEEDSQRLAVVIGQCTDNARLADSIARELKD